MNKDTFCLYPFIHISTERNGSYTCCGASLKYSKGNVFENSVDEIWNDEYFTQLRLDGINGVKNANCETCWFHEQKGVESRRQKINASYERYNIFDYDKIIKQQGKLDSLPIQVNIRVENICNLKCITCNHYHSSQHEKEINSFKDQEIPLPKWIQWVDDRMSIRVNPLTAKKGSVAENLKAVLTKSSKLSIEGGEPLLASMTEEILDYCIANGHTDVEIEIVSNLTSLTDNVLSKLTRFANLKIWISWDHLDSERFRFIRYPADYDQFLTVFRKISQYKQIKLGISCTASVFNIFEVPALLDIFESLTQENLIQEFIFLKPVFMPDYFSLAYLEPEQKTKAIELIQHFVAKSPTYKIMQHPDLPSILSDMPAVISAQPDNFLEVVKERTRMLDLYDKTRNTDYKKLFPYIKQYY